MRAVWPTGTFRGSSYSVMDLGYGQAGPISQPVYSMELSFPAIDAAGRLGCADFVDAVISIVNSAGNAFFTGYVSLRFTGATRASLGMQQWSQTCAVEISILPGVQGLDVLTSRLYQAGIARGACPTGDNCWIWAQGYGGIYPGYDRGGWNWRLGGGANAPRRPDRDDGHHGDLRLTRRVRP
jgi:hypothetical protein